MWKAIREMNAAKRLQGATIGKGGVTIKLGGFLSALYPSSLGGGEATRFGPLLVSESTEPGYAVQLKDEDGNFVFAAVRNTPTAGNPSGVSGIFGTAELVFIDNGAGTGFDIFGDDFEVNAVGSVFLNGAAGTKIQHSTTGASANCFIDPSDNRIWRSTSSRRYKQDIEDAEVDPAAVLDMQPRTWRDKAEVEADPDTERRYVGFIAEELHDLGLGQFVVYDDDGLPEAISYDRLTAAVIPVLKDLNERVSRLEQRAADAEERDEPAGGDA